MLIKYLNIIYICTYICAPQEYLYTYRYHIYKYEWISNNIDVIHGEFI